MPLTIHHRSIHHPRYWRTYKVSVCTVAVSEYKSTITGPLEVEIAAKLPLWFNDGMFCGSANGCGKYWKWRDMNLR